MLHLIIGKTSGIKSCIVTARIFRIFGIKIKSPFILYFPIKPTKDNESFLINNPYSRNSTEAEYGVKSKEGMLESPIGVLVAMKQYQGTQRAFCVWAYYCNRDSIVTARPLYRAEYLTRNAPSVDSIRKWIQMFRNTSVTITKSKHSLVQSATRKISKKWMC